jgi:spoIIIJ-associated protein
MSGELRVEAEGETVGEAKWSALRALERRAPGLDRELVEFQVVSEGERGLLGVGAQPAKVIAVATAAALGSTAAAGRDEASAAGSALAAGRPRDATPRPGESEDAAVLRTLLELAGDAIGTGFDVSVREDDATIALTCSGPDLGLLIGKHGQTIDALQYLSNAILHRRGAGREAVIDAAGYRERRHEALAGIASRAASQALASGRPVELDPMTSVERKHVHLLLKDDPRVETGSDGAEPNRFVVVRPAGA